MLLKVSDITHGRISRPQTYSDFLAYCALLMSSRTDPVHAKQRYIALEQIQKNYNETEWQMFQQGLEALCDTATENTRIGRFDDLFAKTYIQIGASNRSLKQDFTPVSVSQLLAKINLKHRSELPPEGFITVGDPACGSGTLLLAVADCIEENGLNPSAHMVAQAVDLDIRCVHMTYLNLSLYGIPAVVVCGNTFALEERDRWYTPVYLWEKWIWRAPMPFGKGGYTSDEMLKRLDEPMYDKMRRLQALFYPINPDSTLDESKDHTKNDEV